MSEVVIEAIQANDWTGGGMFLGTPVTGLFVEIACLFKFKFKFKMIYSVSHHHWGYKPQINKRKTTSKIYRYHSTIHNKV